MKEDRRAFVIDSDPAIARLWGHVLREAGFRVSSAASVRQALRTLNEGRPFDAVVAEFHLPDGDGLQVLAACTPGTTLVLTASAAIGESAIERAGRMSAMVLSKPFSPEELRRAIREA